MAVDLFREQGPVLMEDGRPVDGKLVVQGYHFHEHLHVYVSEGDRDAERVALEIVREWKTGNCGWERE